MDSKKCDEHKKENFKFYCFDDKKFLCDKCFKNHRKHNIEVKSELEILDNLYKSLNKEKQIKEKLEELKSILTEVKEKIEKKILPKVISLLESFNNLNFKNESSIFDLTFKEYENIEDYVKVFDSIKDINIKINKSLNLGRINKDFRIINKEVNIISNSKVYTNNDFNLDVMLNKKDGAYSLFDGKINHFAIFDFKKKLYIKNVLISVKQGCDCVLKNFKISFKNKEGNWELISSYLCQNEKYEKDMQYFLVDKETQFLKIDFINAWQYGSGNFILIRRLSFEVAEPNDI